MRLLGYLTEKSHQSITEVSSFSLFTGYFMLLLKHLRLNSPVLAIFPSLIMLLLIRQLNALPKYAPNFGHSMPSVWAMIARGLFSGLSQNYGILVILW